MLTRSKTTTHPPPRALNRPETDGDTRAPQSNREAGVPLTMSPPAWPRDGPSTLGCHGPTCHPTLKDQVKGRVNILGGRAVVLKVP